MADGKTIDEMFQEADEEISLEAQLWGKNPKRTEALRDLWLKDMIEFADKNEVPEGARAEMMFSMAANSILDMVMESLPEALALELSYCFDHHLGMFVANKRYGVDILDAVYQTISKLKREDYASLEEFEKAVNDKEERWWTVGKQLLGGHSPNDVIAEALSRYGLNR
jgi:hypothetical protein